MGVENPNFDTVEASFFSFHFEVEYRAHVNHPTYTKTYDQSSTAAAGFHHGGHEFLTGTFKVAIPCHGVDFVRNVVMLEEAGQDSTGAQGIGLKGDEDQDWRREGMPGSLEV